MSNRTDWEELSKEIVDSTWDASPNEYRAELRKRIETELHDAYVAGRERSLECTAPQIHISRIKVHADDSDRLVFGLADTFGAAAKNSQVWFVPLHLYDQATTGGIGQCLTCGSDDKNDGRHTAGPVLVDGLTGEHGHNITGGSHGE